MARSAGVGIRVALVLALLLAPSPTHAAERWTIGLTTNGAVIEALVIAGASADAPKVPRRWTQRKRRFGGHRGARGGGGMTRFRRLDDDLRLLAIAAGNPDAQPLQFPPSGVAYREHIESHVLWRWIGTHAPDLVLVAGPDPGLVDALAERRHRRRPDPGTAGGCLDAIPAVPDGRHHTSRARTRKSSAGWRDRRGRSPRSWRASTDTSSRSRTTSPRWPSSAGCDSANGTRSRAAGALPRWREGQLRAPSQSSLAAHLLFFEYARRARDDRAKALVLRAAASGFTENGDLREFMPLHGGWSDSLFMDVPILAMAGALTGERRYFDMAARHVAFMQQIVLRPDGLYRHQASTDAAWGRGNAFPALGLALTLSEFPKEHADYPRLLASYRAHMAALARFQDENGMWRNVIDRPGAYPEYSATAMIATAMLRGIRNGWIDRETYEPLVEKAWKAILARTGAEGRLVDVCESTGTRGLTDDDYLRRAAILGRDDRGGGMAMDQGLRLGTWDGQRTSDGLEPSTKY